MARSLLKKLGMSGSTNAVATLLSCDGHCFSHDGIILEMSLQGISPLGFENLTSGNP